MIEIILAATMTPGEQLADRIGNPQSGAIALCAMQQGGQPCVQAQFEALAVVANAVREADEPDAVRLRVIACIPDRPGPVDWTVVAECL